MSTGDFKEDTFSDEEKAALGEAEVKDPASEKAELEEKGPEPEVKPEGEVLLDGEIESEHKEKTETEQQAEEMGLEVVTDEKTGKQYIVDEDGARIPPKRFAEIYRKAKDGERTQEKLDLFKKLGPEGYYQAFPDERPPEARREAPRETIPSDTDIGSLIVKQPNGQYDGMTLRDVYAIDPVFATDLQTKFLWQQKEAEQERSNTASKIRQEAATEIETFAESVAQEVFGKTAKGLVEDEEAKITETIQAVLDFMHTTHRGGGNISDAYFLMNKEGLLKTAASKAAAATIKNLQDRKGPASINTAAGDAKDTGFEAMEKMTEEALNRKIDAMNDKEVAEFFKAAPKALRAKYPGLPWG